MNAWAHHRQSGFTRKELVITVVVVVILTLVSTIAYKGLQDRAEYTDTLSRLQLIHRSVNAYRDKQGTFPLATEWQYFCSDSDEFIVGIQDMLEEMPAAPCNGNTDDEDSWAYLSDGSGYKLLYTKAQVSGGYRKLVPDIMRDKSRWSTGTTWGFWTENYADI